VDEAVERNIAARLDRIEQISHRGLAVALLRFELDLGVARLEREDVRRLLDPAASVKQFDLLLAEPLDVEAPPRGEMPEMLDPLIRAREFAGTAETHPLLARCVDLAHDLRLLRARARRRKPVCLRAAWFLRHDTEHLRDHVAGALNLDSVADAHIEP